MCRVNILGFGVMGRQIAALLQLAGLNVHILSTASSIQSQNLYHREVRKFRKTLFADSEPQGTIVFTNRAEALKAALTYEVLPEDIAIKKYVIGRLNYDVTSSGILTNTSSYSPAEIYDGAIGLHFFNPMYLLKFAELSCREEDIPTDIKPLIDLLRNRLSFDIVPVQTNRGYIGNLLLFQEIANALNLIERFGYDTKVIDRVLAHMGRSVSLFHIVDLVGVDVTRQIIINLGEMDSTIIFPPILDKALAMNVLGKKNKTSIRDVIDKTH